MSGNPIKKAMNKILNKSGNESITGLAKNIDKSHQIGTTQANMELRCDNSHYFKIGQRVLFDHTKMRPICPRCGKELKSYGR